MKKQNADGSSRKEKWYERVEKYQNDFIEKAPAIYLMSVISIVLFGGFVAYAAYSMDKPIPYEFEANCNTGFIGVDFEGNFENEPYPQERQLSYSWSPETGGVANNINLTKHDIEFLPKSFNLKNIDGMNCRIKVKGEIPRQAFERIMR